MAHWIPAPKAQKSDVETEAKFVAKVYDLIRPVGPVSLSFGAWTYSVLPLFPAEHSPSPIEMCA